MLLLAFKHTFPRGLLMACATTLPVVLVEYYRTGTTSLATVLTIFAIALAATFLLYVPVEYHNLKTERKR